MTIGSFFNDNSVGWAMGFHTDESSDANNMMSAANNDHIWSNLTNVLSWIPGLSLIAGVYYLYKAHEANELFQEPDGHNEAVYGQALKGRAIASFLQASVILFVIDIIATIGRFSPCCQPETAI